MLYKQTQLGVLSSDEGCHCEQTKPIPAVPADDIPHHSTILLFHHSKRRPIVRNKANLPGYAGCDEARGTGDEGQMRKTNPIWPGWPGRGKGGRESPPGHDGAKQSQFWPEEREGQVACRKGVMVHRTCNRLGQNKANFPERPPRGAGRGSHQPRRRCGVLRQTNPICGSRAGKTIAKSLP